MEHLSEEALALVKPIWGGWVGEALAEVMRDQTARPEQLLNLACVMSLMINKPTGWIDSRHTMMDWATEWVFEYHERIKRDLPNYTREKKVELAAATVVTAETINVAFERKAAMNEVQAFVALLAIVHLYELVEEP